ncbi:hypothetical protein ACH5RR_040862 [Cinchona calisaya]|uniref:Uncharacterized protein n=1 Tax=Cinchona calisaya TaxID=153742 RepID=A0ABD2XXA4_9GENT
MVPVCISYLIKEDKLKEFSTFHSKQTHFSKKKKKAHSLGDDGKERYLNINCAWLGSGFEKVICSPANGFFSILQLTLHEPTKLNHAPREHGGLVEDKGLLDLAFLECEVGQQQIFFFFFKFSGTRILRMRVPMLRNSTLK